MLGGLSLEDVELHRHECGVQVDHQTHEDGAVMDAGLELAPPIRIGQLCEMGALVNHDRRGPAPIREFEAVGAPADDGAARQIGGPPIADLRDGRAGETAQLVDESRDVVAGEEEVGDRLHDLLLETVDALLLVVARAWIRHGDPKSGAGTASGDFGGGLQRAAVCAEGLPQARSAASLLSRKPWSE